VQPEGAVAHRDGHGRVSRSSKAAGYGSGAHDKEGLGESQLVHLIPCRKVRCRAAHDIGSHGLIGAVGRKTQNWSFDRAPK
jgi:hypothetical protein